MPDNQDWIDDLYAEGAEEQPPPELDEKIRAAARQPVQHPWYRSPGRLAALATAASLVIAVSVIYFEPEQMEVGAPVDDRVDLLETPAEQDIAYELEEMPERKRAEMPASAPGVAKVAADSAANEPAMPESVTSPADVARKTTDASASVPAPEPAGRLQAASGMTAREQERVEQNLEARVASSQTDQAAASLQAITVELEALCGPLPGTEQNREITSDAEGWQVIVTIGEDERAWRCIDGAWIEISEQQ